MSISSMSSCEDCNGQNTESSVRRAAVAGTFYPDNKTKLEEMIAGFYKCFSAKENYKNIAAVIVPHAGYVFSGEVAAGAFAEINPENIYDNIFIIGPSHQVYMDGASINNKDDYYETPLGQIKVDTEFACKLIADNPCFSYNPKAHGAEHALEVQLPLMQYHFKHMSPIVPIVIGTQSFEVIRQIAEALNPYFNEKNLFVISSDFSHYPSYDNANKADKRTGEAILKGNVKDFIDALVKNHEENLTNLSTSACGQSAIAVLLLITEGDNNIKIEHVMYRNSGDSEYGGKDKVVGYHSFVFVREKTSGYKDEFTLSEAEKQTLLHIARHAIKNRFTDNDTPLCDPTRLTDKLKMKCGAFVTLHEDRRLKGCIGHFGSDLPLYQTVAEMAASAAFGDPRFQPLEEHELSKVDIEISVLSPLRKIKDIDQFHYGKQGIFMEKDGRTGTFLPQVAQDTNWTKDEFLGHCARDKAGIGWDGWKTANLYTYDAVVFGEKEE